MTGPGLRVHRPSTSFPAKSARTAGSVAAKASSHGQPLAFGQRSDRLAFGKAHLQEEPATVRIPPMALTRQQLSQWHALHLRLAAQDDLRGAYFSLGDAALEVGSDLPYAVGAVKRLTALAWQDVD